jgi:NADPH:quinone reductase-like Zn-dependent oxidoreductase
MKAIRYGSYGPADVLEVRDVDIPAVGDDELLIRVRAASVNPLELHFMTGRPYVVRTQSGLSRPRAAGLGSDFAGTVEMTGRQVTRFRPGDEVFGFHSGAFAEYVAVGQGAIVLAKPARLSFEQAAAVPVAAFTALQALRDKGCLRAGHRVLVNGAGGGVGTFAVQIAKALGAAEVTGVCSTGKVEMVASIGADRVIDHTRADFLAAGRRYDVVVDTAGSRSLRQMRRVLEPDGVLVAVGGPVRGDWFAPLLGPLRAVLYSRFVSQRFAPLLANPNRDDLRVLHGLIEAGGVTPVIDRAYPLDRVRDAIAYLEEGHAAGKVVITV